MYYITIKQYFEGYMSLWYTYDIYFKDKKSIDKWIKKYKEKCYTRQEIYKKGKAYFNEDGVICKEE